MSNLDLIDTRFEAMKRLVSSLESTLPTVLTEADTRLKLIDRILIEVLGWQDTDIFTEEWSGEGFLDYKLALDGVGRIVVEAKKSTRPFDLGTRKSGEAFKLDGPVFRAPDVQEAIKQAISYAAYKSLELACVTNGMEWVVFRANRLGDGLEVLLGKAFIFSSLDAIVENFGLFYDLLAPERVRSLVFRGHFSDAEGRMIRHSEFENRLIPEDRIFFMEQPAVILELDRIMTSFFQRLTDESNQDMLEECFVETHESKAAEQKLLRLADDIVGRIRSLDTGSGKQLSELIESTKITNQNQFILLIGPKGAGKTTFINRFFNLKLPQELREYCVPISVNLGSSDGDPSTIVNWIRSQLLERAEEAVQGRPPTWDEIIGHMFFRDYRRLSNGPMKHLYDSDKIAFKIWFGEYIEKLRNEKPDDYIAGVLRNFVHGRKQIPCVIFDNADHFSIDLQEKAFQYAKSLFEGQMCIVIMPITDKTSWQLSRQGALQSFENEALLLPAPSPKMIVEKRIDFVLAKIKNEDLGAKEKGQYFLGKGIRVDLSDLAKFILTLQEVFLSSPRISHWLGSLSNHSVRRLLELCRDIVNSPHLGFDDALTSYLIKSTIAVPRTSIMKSIIRYRYSAFNASNSKFVHNLFELSGEILTTPLLGIRILQAISDIRIREGETKSEYVSLPLLLEYLENMGIDRRAARHWVDAMLKRALVLDYDPTCDSVDECTKVEISPAGATHLFLATGNDQYLFAMCEVTTIRDKGYYDELISVSNERGNHGREGVPIQHLIRVFGEYLLKEDNLHCLIPDHLSYKGQHDIIKHFTKLGSTRGMQARRRSQTRPSKGLPWRGAQTKAK